MFFQLNCDAKTRKTWITNATILVRSWSDLGPILRRSCTAHCIRLHFFVAQFWLSRTGWEVSRGEEGCREDSPQLPPLTICAEEMNLGQEQRQRQRQRQRQHAAFVCGKVAETFQENHDFLLKIFLGLPNGNAKWWEKRRGKGKASASCAGGFGIDFADTFTNRSEISSQSLYDSCIQFSKNLHVEREKERYKERSINRHRDL